MVGLSDSLKAELEVYSLAAAATSGPGASDRQHLEAELEREQLRDAADNLLLTRHIGGRAYSS